MYKHKLGECPHCDKPWAHTFCEGVICSLCGLGDLDIPQISYAIKRFIEQETT